jgi:hypothetical protein
VHEIVEDTVVQVELTLDDAHVIERPVDTAAGELQLLLEAHIPGEMRAEGLSGVVDELFFGHLRRQLDAFVNLVLVPFGYLRNLPFHALATTARAIDKRSDFRISYLPSISFVETRTAPPSVDSAGW